MEDAIDEGIDKDELKNLAGNPVIDKKDRKGRPKK